MTSVRTKQRFNKRKVDGWLQYIEHEATSSKRRQGIENETTLLFDMVSHGTLGHDSRIEGNFLIFR